MTRLVVLVADKDAEVIIRVILSERYHSLGLPKLIENEDYKIIKHNGRDPGVFASGSDVIALLRSQFSHALVIIDQEWGGTPGNSIDIKQQLGSKLRPTWGEQHLVVVPEPEIDAWIWAKNNTHVSASLGADWEQIMSIARAHSWWMPDEPKPSRPKELLDAVVYKVKNQRHHTSGIFAQIAKQISLNNCVDPAFNEMKLWLQEIFFDAK